MGPQASPYQMPLPTSQGMSDKKQMMQQRPNKQGNGAMRQAAPPNGPGPQRKGETLGHGLVVRDAFCAIMYSSKTYYFYQPPVFFFLH
jgi:hypothetical protein